VARGEKEEKNDRKKVMAKERKRACTERERERQKERERHLRNTPHPK